MTQIINSQLLGRTSALEESPGARVPWLINIEPRTDAHIRLICAHHAGGSAQYFEQWPSALPPEIEVVCVNLPGRGVRRNEPFVRNLAAVVDAVCNDIVSYLDRPYAMFGDSIGALVCFEVIRELRKRGEPLPLRFFASGMVAPHIVWWNPDTPLYRLEDAALFEGLIRDAGMLDEMSLSNADLREVMTPVLRADLEIAETYSFNEQALLSVPISAIRGESDILLTADQLDGWSEHTSMHFEHKTFPGAHFYSRQSRNDLLDLIVSRLRDDISNAPVSVIEGEAYSYPQQCLHEVFSEQAAATPDALALAQHSTRYTYQELDQQTDMLAHWLISNGVKPRDLVGILMERCVEHVVALIAINKAGAIFMPLDTAYPPETMEKFIRASEARIVLSKPQWIDKLSASLSELCTWVSLDEKGLAELAIDEAMSSNIILPQTSPDETAFMSMSSGTSGAPKGICQSHRAAVNAYWHRYLHAPYRENEREACNVYFIWYVWLPLLRGASAWIVPDDVIYDPRLLVSFIKENEITRSTISPSLLERVLRTPGLDLRHALRSLRNITIIGEVVPSALVREFHSIVPNCTLTHGYGCAETHDAVSRPLDPMMSTVVSQRVAPAGRPQINQRIYVLDEFNNPQPRGVSGEIHVGGDSLANGYFCDAENTAARFVPDPLRSETDRLFKTGDRGRMLPGGDLQVLGRIDSMVKLRGYSVMLGVVEGALLEHPAISNTTVIAAVDEETGRPDHLIAYAVTGAKGPTEGWCESMRLFLAERLPHYAIPAFVVPLESLPVDSRSNSKIDRRGLPKPGPEHRLTSMTQKTPPRNQQDAEMLQTWSDVLGVYTIGIDDDFFVLGGHSLLAAELCSRLDEQFGCMLRVVEIFDHPTVAQLSDRITQKKA